MTDYWLFVRNLVVYYLVATAGCLTAVSLAFVLLG